MYYIFNGYHGVMWSTHSLEEIRLWLKRMYRGMTDKWIKEFKERMTIIDGYEILFEKLENW